MAQTRTKLLVEDYPLTTAGVVLRPVSIGDLKLYRDLVTRASGFFDAFEGGFPSDESLRDTFTELPPGCSPEDKNSIGVFDVRSGSGSGSTLVGFADIVAGYPDSDSWYIGLLLLAEDVRGRGLGSAVISALESLLVARGARDLYLAVYDANIPGRAFWQALGFVPVKHAPEHRNAVGELLPTTRLRKSLVV
ncbi:MAG: GNAT family N-acetyltransferase [Propionibacteriaceae bacterium]|jgi:GNAT superfamily N-acetyltransferase|nr:GNAT family N-acetyltransferase [Propionibacteriaceae bacterium]